MSAAAAIALEAIMPPRLGTVDPAAYPDEEFDLYSIPAHDAGEPDVAKGRQIGSAKQVVKPGDVLLSRIVPHIRRAWVVGDDRGRRIIASGEWIVFRGPSVVPRYLRHVLVGDPFHAEFMNTVSGVGGSLLRARPIHVAKIRIPIPPLPEQRRIAEILDKADALRAKRRAALAQLDTLTQSIFFYMFGDPATNPKGFPIRPLAEFYVNSREGTKCGPFGSALKARELVSSGIPVWNMDNIAPLGRMALPFRMWITEAKYRELEAYAVIDGDVLISRAGTVGKMCVVRAGYAKSIISTNLIRVRFGPNLLPTYFVSLMTFCRGRVGRLRTGPDGAFSHMSTGVLDDLRFPHPPVELQQRFATILDLVEQRKSKQRTQLTELDTLFASLQQRSFAGTHLS